MNPFMEDLSDNFTKLAQQAASPVKDMITRLGRISPDYSGGQVLVYFDGESQGNAGSGRPVSCSSAYTPAANERVLLIGSGATWMVLCGVAGTNMGYNGTSVTAYGAKGDGETDDTAAIQNAINGVAQLGGGTVHFPPGKYVVSITNKETPYGTDDYALWVPSNIRLIGAGAGARSVKSPDSTTDPAYFGWDSLAEANVNPAELGGVTEIVCDDLAGSVILSINTRFVTIEHLKVTGPGRGVGGDGEANTTHGIRFGYQNLDPMVAWDGTSVPFYINLTSVHVQQFGGDGFRNQTVCVATYRNCTASEINGTGFNHPEGSTSNSYTGCWARNCTVGWHFQGSIYINLAGCAADYCNTSYWASDSQTITWSGCGSEFPIDTGAGSARGYSWRFDQNTNTCVVMGGEVIGNPYRAIIMTDGVQSNTLIGIADNGPMPSAEYFYVSAVGTITCIINMRLSSPCLYLGRDNILDDNQGSMKVGLDATIGNDLRVERDAFILNKLYVGNTAGAPELDCDIFRLSTAKMKTTARFICDGIGINGVEPSTAVPGGWAANGRVEIFDGSGNFVGYVQLYT